MIELDPTHKTISEASRERIKRLIASPVLKVLEKIDDKICEVNGDE